MENMFSTDRNPGTQTKLYDAGISPPKNNIPEPDKYLHPHTLEKEGNRADVMQTRLENILRHVWRRQQITARGF